MGGSEAARKLKSKDVVLKYEINACVAQRIHSQETIAGFLENVDAALVPSETGEAPLHGIFDD